MDLWQKIAHYAIDTAGEVGKSVAMDYVRTRSLRVTETTRSYLSLDLDSPPGETHCPYCQITDNLSAAYRYLVRTKDRRSYAGIYQELARVKVTEAVMIISDLPNPPNSRQGRLLTLVNGIDVLLAQPASIERLQAIAKGIWDTSELALDLAEYANVPAALAEPPSRAYDEDVIEGESKVIEE